MSNILCQSIMLLHNCTLNFSLVFMKRLFSSTKILNLRKKPKPLSRKYKNLNSNLELLSSLFNSSIEQYLDVMHINILNTFLKPVKDSKCVCTFVIDETVAKDIVKKISCTPNDVVIEGNPGLGLITINLIKSGVSHVYVLEKTSLQYLSLLQIILKYTRRITRQNLLINQSSCRAISLSLDSAAKHSSTIKFLGICTSYYFIRSLVQFFRIFYSRIKNLEMYLVITSDIFRSIESFSPKNLKYVQYCALNLFFNIHKLASYPRNTFLPPSRDNNDNMLLVKMTINSDFLENFDNDDDVEEYFIFITILGRKKSNYIISTLEKWIPDCGPYLISKGVSMLNQIKDLSPQDSFTLFKLCKKLEGYDYFRNCTLHIFQRAN